MPKPLSECRILVTPRSYGAQDAALKKHLESQVKEVLYNEWGQTPTPRQCLEKLPGVDGWIAGVEKIPAEVLEAADACLKVIARYGVGYSNVDLEAARKRGIVVTNTPGANATAVAELTLALGLAVARNLVRANEVARQGQWPKLDGVGLAGKTWGILGLGAIGKKLAPRLSALGLKVIACDPYVDAATMRATGAAKVELAGLLSASDFLSLHLPASAETNKLVNADFLARMKKGAILINTARGELVDEAALAAALQSGKLHGAALDVLEAEPPAADNPLLRLDNVLLTPHTGAHTDEATNAMGRMATEECLAVLEGREPKYRVN